MDLTLGCAAGMHGRRRLEVLGVHAGAGKEIALYISPHFVQQCFQMALLHQRFSLPSFDHSISAGLILFKTFEISNLPIICKLL